MTAGRSATATPWSDLAGREESLELEQFLSFQVIRLAHSLQKLSVRAYLSQDGLSVADWRVLGFVRRHQPVQSSRLGLQMFMDKAQVSRTVRHLTRRGLLRTAADPDHAQRLLLSLTPTGRRLMEKLMPAASRIQHGLLNQLPADQRDVLWQAIQTLQQQLETPPVPLPPRKHRTSHE